LKFGDTATISTRLLCFGVSDRNVIPLAHLVYW
jgi:hypothetical protein